MRNKYLQSTILALGFFLFSTGVASALPLAGQSVKIFNGEYGVGSGGEFKIDVIGSSPNPDYIGFCLELNEFLNYNTTYKIKGVDEFAENGGKGGQLTGTNKDFLSDQTKWLFYNYLYGNYDWSRGTIDRVGTGDSRADNVQNTIWYLEGEQSSYNSNLLSIVNLQTDYSINGIVKVLNIVDRTTGGYKQSLIIGEPVPEPGTLFLMGTGLAGLAAYARRRKKQ